MSVNLTETMQRIKKAGAEKARAVPMEGQSAVSGQYQIEIKEGDGWSTVASGLTKSLAEQVIAQATNRVICG